MTTEAPTRTLVLGLGNGDRGDDAVGAVVARRLRRWGLPVTVRVWEGADVDLLDAWHGFERVIVIDAALSDDPPGTIHHSVGGPPGGAALPGGTHGWGLASVIDLAELLGRRPPRLEVVAVTVGSLDHGAPLSPAVAAAAEQVAAELRVALARPMEAR